ncbi:MAG TPA: hypothetical protein VG308_16045, partial [Stellaceae bacterium]|nr:hypothetical protein [Stellaceae bacterium]
MPRYVIERQYLVPMYEHVLVEAPDAEAAFRKALDEVEQPWEDIKEDYENSRPTTIERAVELPTFMDIDGLSMAHVLYDAGLDTLAISNEFVDDNIDQVGFV